MWSQLNGICLTLASMQEKHPSNCNLIITMKFCTKIVEQDLQLRHGHRKAQLSAKTLWSKLTLTWQNLVKISKKCSKLYNLQPFREGKTGQYLEAPTKWAASSISKNKTSSFLLQSVRNDKFLEEMREGFPLLPGSLSFCSVGDSEQQAKIFSTFKYSISRLINARKCSPLRIFPGTTSLIASSASTNRNWLSFQHSNTRISPPDFIWH